MLHKDKEVLREYVDEVLEGPAVGMRLVGAGRGVVGIKEKYHDVIDLLRSKLPGNMEVAPLRDAYPAGDEFILVYDVLGRVIPPGGIPLAVGAVVMNVETAMNVARAAQQPVTEKYLTVAGAVAEPVTLRVPLGVTLAQCVAAAGGPTIADANYIVGGVMMGYLRGRSRGPGRQDHRRRDRPARRSRASSAAAGRIGSRSPASAAAPATSAAFARNFARAGCWAIPIEPHRAMRSLGSTWSARPT